METTQALSRIEKIKMQIASYSEIDANHFEYLVGIVNPIIEHRNPDYYYSLHNHILNVMVDLKGETDIHTFMGELFPRVKTTIWDRDEVRIILISQSTLTGNIRILVYGAKQ